MADTDYVECHGTGTAVGDPVEVEGIGRCFSPRYGPPLMIGAVCLMTQCPSNTYTATNTYHKP